MAPSRAHHACQDFHHASEATRNAVFTRRQALRFGVGAGLSIYAQRNIPFLRALEAATAEAQARPDAPILVSVFLPGGLDLLDTLVPLGQEGRYRDLRGPIVPDGITPLSDGSGMGMQPALSQGADGGLRGLYERGQLGFLPGIDYANPNLSHFTSRVFWDAGMVTQKQVSGWLGRWLDRNGSMDNPFQGLSSGYGVSPLLRTARAPVASMLAPGSATLGLPALAGGGADYVSEAVAAYGDLGAPSATTRPGPRAVADGARFAHSVHARMQPLLTRGNTSLTPAAPYPAGNDTATHLQTLAALLDQPLGIRFGTVEASGGWDSHANQNGTLSHDLGALSDALSAFQADLEARGLADRTLTFVWSEFGRRPQANRSNGTDHGAGGIGWVMGPRARSGILTDYPSLTDLDRQSNLKVSIDFRAVYASLIAQWLGTDPADVIPDAGAFGQVALVR
jgi:uncharacterized protein (DUF1501 family)